MTIRFDSGDISSWYEGVSSFSWEHTIEDFAEFPGMVVSVAIHGVGVTVTSVTYAGRNMEFIRAEATGLFRIELWYVRNLDVGLSSIEVTLSGAADAVGGSCAYSFFGGGIDVHGGGTGVGNPANLDITPTQDNSYIFASMVTSTNDNMQSGDGQTTRWALFVNPVYPISMIGSDKGPISPADFSEMIYTTIGVTDVWAMTVVAFLDLVQPPPRVMGMGL